MLDFYLIVIGTSAGGLTPLKSILSSLPKDFPAAVLVVKHISTTSFLAGILSKVSALRVIHPKDNQSIQPGYIYIAPPNFHMVVAEGKIQLKKGPRVNHSIPAIDPLFYSAAIYNKNRTIGVLLSGLLDDGSAGLLAVKKCNGITIVQDAEEAEYPDMPLNGLRAATIDYCLPAAGIETVLKEIVMSSSKKKEINSKKKGTKKIPDINLFNNELNMNYTEADNDEQDMNNIGKTSAFSCPECNGVLWKINDKDLERYRCRVGHAYGLDGLMRDKDKSTSAALWAALRALEEKRHLTKNLVARAKKNNPENLHYLQEGLEELKANIDSIRLILKQ